ncbi:MAG: NADH-quinone oxidoreductase subunit J [FCB group bacterium]|nr:NADH-quinone oxidoreductase subunit J [FCB group bacterium]
MAEAAFWLVVAVTLVSAFIVVTSRNLFYSAISLLFTFFGVAGLYIFLWADFLAGVQVLIYIGGILILILFGIMLTHKITSVDIAHTSIQQGVGGIVVLFLFAALAWMIVRTPWLVAAAPEPQGTAGEIGKLLMTDYLLPFEVASVLLLGALLGAAVLSRKGN